MITVKYFASFREAMGISEETIEVAGVRSVRDVWDKVAGDKIDSTPRQALCAVNCRYAEYETTVNDGDEVAFFPPVTGG